MFTGVIKDTSRDKSCQELGLEWLQQHRLCLLQKFTSTGQILHIYNLIPKIRNSHIHPNIFHVFPCRTEYFKNSCFPHAINECNKLYPIIRSSRTYHNFRNPLLKFIKPVEKKFFNINGQFGIKLLTRLRLGFSHLLEHKFRHGFEDTLNPLSSGNTETETTTHYFLRCRFCNSNWATVKNYLENISISFPTVIYNNLISLLLYDDDKFYEKYWKESKKTNVKYHNH